MRQKHSFCLLLKITGGVRLPGLDVQMWQHVFASPLPTLCDCSCNVSYNCVSEMKPRASITYKSEFRNKKMALY